MEGSASLGVSDVGLRFRHFKSAARGGGFTLLEVLVVVAIIGILASLVSAAVVSAKNKARQTQCAANLHQVGLALQTFVTDHGCYPLASSANEIETERYPEHRRVWVLALFPEKLNKQGAFDDLPKILDCPSASQPAEFPATLGYADYGYNSRGLGGLAMLPQLGLGGKGPGSIMVGRVSVASYPPPVAEPEVASPSDMLAIGDGFNGWRGIIRDGLSLLGRAPDAQGFMGSTARSQRRHGGHANVVFCDGHVNAPRLDFLFNDETDAALRIWNRDAQPHRERLNP